MRSGSRFGVSLLDDLHRADLDLQCVPYGRNLWMERTLGKSRALTNDDFVTATEALINPEYRIDLAVRWHEFFSHSSPLLGLN